MPLLRATCHQCPGPAKPEEGPSFLPSLHSSHHSPAMLDTVKHSPVLPPLPPEPRARGCQGAAPPATAQLSIPERLSKAQPRAPLQRQRPVLKSPEAGRGGPPAKCGWAWVLFSTAPRVNLLSQSKFPWLPGGRQACPACPQLPSAWIKDGHLPRLGPRSPHSPSFFENSAKTEGPWDPLNTKNGREDPPNGCLAGSTELSNQTPHPLDLGAISSGALTPQEERGPAAASLG